MPGLTEPVALAGRTAPSRVLFGPHETNLGHGRAFSERHTAYYARRAQGGAGIVVTETASVTADDWPYERAPLAAESGPGWAMIADAVHASGGLVLAGLGHAGAQGSSAFSQSVLWAPSAVADSASREMPAVMEQQQIDAVVEGFAQAAALAAASGLDGVELDAGSHALLRQFHSGLTNLRDDAYGEDKLLLTREVVTAVRSRLGDGRILALRLSGDELAPWAGVTPEQAEAQVDALADLLDLLVVVRAGPFATTAYRPTGHTPPGFNADLCRQLRTAAGARVPVVLQGSVVDPAAAQAALDDGVCDLVEMTRAQLADPDLVAHVRAGTPGRPCILCNQACRVRDNRNPVVSCVGEPATGHEATDGVGTGAPPGRVLVVGGGPAGLEAARAAALAGHAVTLAERTDALGGTFAAAAAGPGRDRFGLLTSWLAAEVARLGVEVRTGEEVTASDLDRAADEGRTVILATGSIPRELSVSGVAMATPDTDKSVFDALDVLAGTAAVPDGPVVVHDPVGGPVGVAVAEVLAADDGADDGADGGRAVHVVTGDQVVGTLLSLSGDLAPANTRLQQAGVVRELRSVLREIGAGRVVLEDVWTGERRTVAAAGVVDCSTRLPEETLYAARPGTPRAGDCVAPRTVLEAILEGRRRAADVRGLVSVSSRAIALARTDTSEGAAT